MGSSPPQARRATIAALASFLLAGGILGWAYLARSGAAPEKLARQTSSPKPPPAVAVEAEPPPPEDAAPGVTESTPEPSAALHSFWIVGRIFQRDAGDRAPRPLAGARVSLRRSREDTARPDAATASAEEAKVPAVAVDSGADGRFRILAPYSGHETCLDVQSPPLAQRAIELPAWSGDGPGSEYDLGDIILRSASPLTVRVLDPEGTPVPNAHVSATHLAQFHLRDRRGGWGDGSVKAVPAVPASLALLLLKGESYSLTAKAPGWKEASERITLPASGPAEVSIELTRLVEAQLHLAGIVQSPSGVPVSGARATLSLDYEGRTEQATADVEGRFAFDARAVVPASLDVEAEGFQPWSEEFDESREGLEVTLVEAWSLDVEVVTADGKPIEGASVHLVAAEDETRDAKSDATGRVRVEDLLSGEVRVEVEHEAFQYTDSVRVEVGPGIEEPHVLIRLEEGQTLAVRLTDAKTGAPIEGGLVSLSPPYYGEYRWVRDRRAPTGPDGTALVRGLDPSVRWSVGGGAKGYLDATLGELRLSEANAPVEVALRRTATVEGRTVDPDGNTVAEALVWLDPRGMNQSQIAVYGLLQVARSAVDGAFRIQGIIPDKGFVLRAHAEGFPMAVARIVDLGDGEASPGIVIRFPRPAVVEGRVVGPGGTGVAGAHVSVRQASDREIGLWAFTPVYPFLALPPTDDDGRFRASPLEPGTLEISAWTPELRCASQLQIELVEGEVATVQIELVPEVPAITLEGRVVDNVGAPVADAKVTAHDSGAYPETTTDPDGRFHLEGVRGESGKVEVEKEGYTGDWKVFDGAGEDLVVELTPTGVARMRARVPPGFERSRMVATARPLGNDDAIGGDSQEIHASDPWAVELPAGRYVFEVNVAGLLPARSAELVVRPGERGEEVVIELTEGATIRGRVRYENGDAAPGVDVSAMRLDAGDEDSPWDPPWGKSSVHGDFEIAGIPAGHVRLETNHATIVQLTFPELVLGERNGASADVLVCEGGRLHGKLVGFNGPHPFIKVTALRSNGSLDSFKHCRVETGDFFDLEGLPPGAGAVEIYYSPGLAPTIVLRRQVFIRAGEVNEAELRLDPRVPLAGRVTLRGAPLEDARVKITQEERTPGNTFSTKTRSNADGQFSLEVLPGLPGTIEVEDADGRTKLRRPLAPPSGGERVELEP